MTIPRFVRVYTLPDCQQCVATTRWLSTHHVPYGITPIDDDSRAAARDLGITSAPIVALGTGPDARVHGGFDPDKLAVMAAELEQVAA